MKRSGVLALMIRKWFVYLLIMFSIAKCDHQTIVPAAGLLCISECEKCPVVCSPSAQPGNSKPPPPLPAHHHSPPVSPPPPPSYISWGGQQNYSNPYNYYYASQASFFSFLPSFVAAVLSSFVIVL